MPCKQCDNGKYKYGNGDCKYDSLQECEQAHDTYDIVELVVDDENEALAIDAISLVTSPAIETDFVYFNATENNLTLAKEKVSGVHTVESWIVEDSKNDKSNLYGYELPKGTWFVSMRVNNDEVWQRIKSGELKGLSIEGYFVDKMETLSTTKKELAEPVGEVDGLPLFVNEQDALEYAKKLGCEGTHKHEIDGDLFYMPCSDHDIIKTIAEILEEDDANKELLESYTDYPQSASNNAKKAIEYKEENGSSCGTQVGWTRARQLADRKPISRDTIARMASFKRHEQHADVPYTEGCGGIMYDAWGGKSGVNWAISKLKQIDKK